MTDYDLIWGRPLDQFWLYLMVKILFKFDHIETTDKVIIEQNLDVKLKKFKILLNTIPF